MTWYFGNLLNSVSSGYPTSEIFRISRFFVKKKTVTNTGMPEFLPAGIRPLIINGIPELLPAYMKYYRYIQELLPAYLKYYRYTWKLPVNLKYHLYTGIPEILPIYLKYCRQTKNITGIPEILPVYLKYKKKIWFIMIAFARRSYYSMHR